MPVAKGEAPSGAPPSRPSKTPKLVEYYSPIISLFQCVVMLDLQINKSTFLEGIKCLNEMRDLIYMLNDRHCFSEIHISVNIHKYK